MALPYYRDSIYSFGYKPVAMVNHPWRAFGQRCAENAFLLRQFLLYAPIPNDLGAKGLAGRHPGLRRNPAV